MKLNVKMLTRASLLAALVFAVTRAIQIPIGGGYLNLGDSVIYISSFFLPFPVAGLAGTTGAALSDVLSGYAVYVIPTAIVKFLLVGIWGWLAKKSKSRMVPNIIIAVCGTVITCAGYGLADLIIWGDMNAVFANMWLNALQSIVCGTIFILVTLYIRSNKNGKNLLSK